MNAARRAIVSDLKHRGLSPKEAYEATKSPEFMAKWVRLVVSRKHLLDADSKPKPDKIEGWITRFMNFKLSKEIKKRAAEVSENKLSGRRKKFIAKKIAEGFSLYTAEDQWQMVLEKERETTKENLSVEEKRE